MAAVCTSETSVYFNEITRCYIPASCHVQGCNAISVDSRTVMPYANYNLPRDTLLGRTVDMVRMRESQVRFAPESFAQSFALPIGL
jgi:hypothetical protein